MLIKTLTKYLAKILPSGIVSCERRLFQAIYRPRICGQLVRALGLQCGEQRFEP